MWNLAEYFPSGIKKIFFIFVIDFLVELYKSKPASAVVMENVESQVKPPSFDRRGTSSFNLVEHWGQMLEKEVPKQVQQIVDKLSERLHLFTEEVKRQVQEEEVQSSEIVRYQQSTQQSTFGKNPALDFVNWSENTSTTMVSNTLERILVVLTRH